MPKPHHLPDGSADCLECACCNPDNRHAKTLLDMTEALTATGVLAAVFVATSDEHATLVHTARAAIAEEREACEANGRARRRKSCWHTHRHER
jgi:hypothetical protein